MVVDAEPPRPVLVVPDRERAAGRVRARTHQQASPKREEREHHEVERPLEGARRERRQRHRDALRAARQRAQVERELLHDEEQRDR